MKCLMITYPYIVTIIRDKSESPWEQWHVSLNQGTMAKWLFQGNVTGEENVQCCDNWKGGSSSKILKTLLSVSNKTEMVTACVR